MSLTLKEKLILQYIVKKSYIMPEQQKKQWTKSKESEKTLIVQQHFLDYCYWNRNAVKINRASSMIMFVDSNVSYLTAPDSKGCAVGFFYLGEVNFPSHAKCVSIVKHCIFL